jgi:hypothetical protein
MIQNRIRISKSDQQFRHKPDFILQTPHAPRLTGNACAEKKRHDLAMMPLAE